MSKQYLVTLTEEERADLGRRVAAGRSPARELAPALGGPVTWRFTTEDARVTLERLYPSIEG